MDWGLLQGLGQGLSIFGNMKMEQDAEKRRTMLAQQVEKDREARASQMYDPSQDSVEQGSEGVWFKVRRNKNGDVIDRVLAPKNVIEQMQAESKERGLKSRLLEAQTSNAEYTGQRSKVEDEQEDADRNLLTPEERRQEARIKAGLDTSAGQKLTSDTSLRTALTRVSGKEQEKDSATIADYADDYLKNNPAVAARFIDTKELTQNEAKAAVINVLRAFTQRGVKPAQSDFDRALQAYVNWKKGNQKSGSSGISVSLKENNG